MTDFEQKLVQAMEDFADRAQPPIYDADVIQRRTRHRRAVFTVTTSAATVLVCAGAAFALHPSGRSPERTVTAPAMTAPVSASTAPPKATVPSVVGMSQGQATRVLDAAALSVGSLEEAPSRTVPAGEVITESPAPGSVAARGAAVTLVVSQGAPRP